MRKYNQTISCCANEKDYNTLIYGRENRYTSCDIDYLYDIQIPLLRNSMKEYLSTDYGVWQRPKYATYLKDILNNHFGTILPFLCYEYSDKIQNTVSQQIRKNYQDYLTEYKIRRTKAFPTIPEKDLISGIDTLENWARTECVNLHLLDILDCVNNTFNLTKCIIPNDMISIIEEHIKKMYRYLRLKDELTFITDKKQITYEDNSKESLLIKGQTIVIKDICFDNSKKTSNLLKSISTNGCLKRTTQPLILDNCFFDAPCELKTLGQKRPILFRNCHFNKSVTWLFNWACNRIIFDNCIFSADLELHLKHTGNLYICDCVIEKDGQLKLEWTIKEKDKQEAEIANCTFYGGFDLSNCNDIKLKMENITFYKPFTIKDTTFNKDTKISNFCFPSNTTEAMETAKMELYDALVASDLKIIAEKLNLPVSKKASKKKPLDYDSYQIELATGWLRNASAVRYLGKEDPQFLTKKRFYEKGKIINTTIPYRGKGKSIQYPVDALQAFKIQDWEELRKLRKKYNFTGQA